MSGLVAGYAIGGKYRLVAPLGRGAMGEVWRAEHLLLRTPLAIKCIHPQHLTGLEIDPRVLLERFFQEAQATAALRSPHVVQILDYGWDGNVPFIAMEMLEGETLEARLQRQRTLTPQQTAHVITHVARAVGRAHEAGIIHRDLKPSNVFLVRNDDEEIAKVLDFGLAKVATGASGYRATQTGMTVGTPAYMSPEQIQASRQLDHRTDLWAMGVMAFECLTGQLPFDGDVFGALVIAICISTLPVPSSRGRVPAGFDAWFAKAAARNPEERFQSAKELSESLRAVLCPESRASRPSFTSVVDEEASAWAPTVVNPQSLPSLPDAAPRPPAGVAPLARAAAPHPGVTPIPVPVPVPVAPPPFPIAVAQPPQRSWAPFIAAAAGAVVVLTATVLWAYYRGRAPAPDPAPQPPAFEIEHPSGPTPLTADPVPPPPSAAPSGKNPLRPGSP